MSDEAVSYLGIDWGVVPARAIYARVRIDVGAIDAERAKDRALEARMVAGGLSGTRRKKTRRRIRAHRFYVRTIAPDLQGIIDDMRARRGLAE